MNIYIHNEIKEEVEITMAKLKELNEQFKKSNDIAELTQISEEVEHLHIKLGQYVEAGLIAFL